MTSASNSSAPPNDLEAEAAVLSAVLLDPTVLDDVRTLLRTEHFYQPENRSLWDALGALSEAGEAIDVLTVSNWLRAHDKWSAASSSHLARILDETPSVPNVREHATIVRNLYRVRQAIFQAQRVATEARDMRGADAEQVQGFLEATEVTFSDLAHADQPAKLIALRDILIEVHRGISIACQQKSAVTGVATGYRALDQMMTGLHGGDLTIIAGRTSMGKSALALSMARKIALSGYAVAFFSLEVPSEQVGLRLLAMESGIDLNKLRSGRLEGSHWSQIAAALQALSALPLFVNDTAAISLMEVRACTRQLAREVAAGTHLQATTRALGMVGLDYMQLVTPSRQGRSREEEVSMVSRGLKRLAKEQDVPYVAVAQLNRKPDNRPDHRPLLSDLRESGAIEQDADTVLLLHRPEYYVKDDPALQGWAEVNIAKQRNGPTGIVKLAYKSRCTQFENLDEYHTEADYDHAAFSGDYPGSETYDSPSE